MTHLVDFLNPFKVNNKLLSQQKIFKKWSTTSLAITNSLTDFISFGIEFVRLSNKTF